MQLRKGRWIGERTFLDHTLPNELYFMILGYLDFKDALALRATCNVNKIRSCDAVERILLTKHFFRSSKRSVARLQNLPDAFVPHIGRLIFETEGIPGYIFSTNQYIMMEYRRLRQIAREAYVHETEKIRLLANTLLHLKHVDTLHLGAVQDRTRIASLIRDEVRCNETIANAAVGITRRINQNLYTPTGQIRMMLSAMMAAEFTCRRLTVHNIAPYVLQSDNFTLVTDTKEALQASLSSTRTICFDLLWNIRHKKQMHTSSVQLVTNFLQRAANLEDLELRITSGGVCNHLDGTSGSISESGKAGKWSAEIAELFEHLCLFKKLSKLRIDIKDIAVPPQSLCELITKLSCLQCLTLQNIAMSGDQWVVIFNAVSELTHLERLSLTKLRIDGPSRAQRRDLWAHKLANEDGRLREIEPTRKCVWRGAQMIQRNMKIGMALFEPRAG